MRLRSLACIMLISVCLFYPLDLFAWSKGNGMPGEKHLDKNTTVIRGTVKDAENNEGIPAATVLAEGTSRGTTTDVNGNFKLELPQGKSFTLIVRFTGYAEKKVDITTDNPEKSIEISLSPSLFDLDEVVVTGTRTQKTLMNSPVLTRIIPMAQIERNDFVSMIDVLEYTIPGMQFNSDPRGDNIRIQGLENKYILILVDGERMSTTPGGPIDFDRLSTSNIKQIEIVKGASSALYGSSAIGMVVNIITKTPERPLEGWGKVRYSRFNDLLLDAGVGTAYKDFTAQTLFSRTSQDGYDLTPDSPESYTKDPSTNMSIEERLGWSNEKTKISAIGSLFFNEVKNPKESTKKTHYKSNNKTIRTTAEHELNQWNNLRFVYFGDFYTRETVYERLKEEEKNATSHVQTLRLTDTYSPTRNFEMIFGGEYNWNRDYNVMQFGENKKVRKVNDINGFAQADWQILPVLDIIGGFRYTHHSAFGNAFMPKVSIMYNPGQLRVRGGYGRGFKAPDATELYSDFMMGSVSHNIGNPDLKAEKSNYYTVSAEYTYKNVNMSVEVYQNDIKNKIQSAFVLVKDEHGVESTELRYRNVEDVRIRGLEVNMDYRPLRNLLLNGAYTYTNAKDEKTGLQLRGNTRHAVSCNASYRFDLFKRETSISVTGRWTSKKINDSEDTSVDPDTGEKVTEVSTNSQPAYSLWKCTLQYTPWKHKDMTLTVSGGVQNIFNYTDNVHYTTYDPGRRVFGSLLFKF